MNFDQSRRFYYSYLRTGYAFVAREAKPEMRTVIAEANTKVGVPSLEKCCDSKFSSTPDVNLPVMLLKYCSVSTVLKTIIYTFIVRERLEFYIKFHSFTALSVEAILVIIVLTCVLNVNKLLKV